MMLLQYQALGSVFGMKLEEQSSWLLSPGLYARSEDCVDSLVGQYYDVVVRFESMLLKDCTGDTIEEGRYRLKNPS